MYNVFRPDAGTPALIDQMVGDQFPIIENLVRNIEYIKHVSHHLAEIYRVYESVSGIDTLFNNITKIDSIVFDIIKINDVHASLGAINALYTELSSLVQLAINTPALIGAAAEINSILVSIGDLQTALNTAQANATLANNSATAASGSATAAGISETNASTSATNAAGSASTATTKASEAGISASNAATSETNTINAINALAGSAVAANTRADLKGINTNNRTVVVLKEPGREGLFVWTLGDYSAHITADIQEGVFIKADAVLTSVGAWVRVFAQSLNIKWFGALGNNSNDDTPAINAAKAVAALFTTNVSLFIPAGLYRLTSAVTDFNRAITVRGEGKRNSILLPVGTVGLAIRGTDSRAADVTFENFSINGSGMTAGDALVIDFTQQTTLTDFAIYDPFNGIYLRQTGNNVFNNFTVDGNIRGSYAFKAYGANIARNGQNDQIDVLQFNNCLFQGVYKGTATAPSYELFVLDGRVHSIQINGLRCLSGLRGFVTRNTPGLPINFTPRFIVGSGLETENTYAEGILLTACDDLRLSDVFAARAFAADGIVVSTACGSVTLNKGYSGSNSGHGINNQGCAFLSLIDFSTHNNSLVGGNAKSGLYIGGSGRTYVRGGTYGKATWLPAYTEPQKYGIDIDPAAGGEIKVDGANLTGNATGPIYDGGVNTIQTGSYVRGCSGYNPGTTSLVTAPATGGSITSGFRDQMVTIYGGSGVVVSIDGVAVANTTPCAFFLPARKAAVITHTGAPTIAVTRL